jgi:hypothetical protein
MRIRKLTTISTLTLLGSLLMFWPSSSIGQAGQHGSFLSWTAPAVTSTTGPAASYNIYRSTVSGGPYTLIANVTTTSFEDPIAGLVTGTTYFYVVKTVNSIGVEGATSTEVSGLIPNASGAVSGLVDVVK